MAKKSTNSKEVLTRGSLSSEVPGSQERPDYEYLSATSKERQKFSKKEIAQLTEETGKYDRKRFTEGRRFRVVQEYHGVPGGTGCTVVSVWPKTRIRWDKWSKAGYGSLRLKEDMHFELDIRLQYIEEKQ